MLKLILICIAILFAACTAPTRKQPAPVKPSAAAGRLKLGEPVNIGADGAVKLYPTEFKYLSGWDSDNHALAYRAFQRSCRGWRKQADGKPLGGILPLGKLSHWKRLCAIETGAGGEKQFFETWFKPYAVADGNSFEGVFTGYYMPELHGSFQQSRRYHAPVYGMPKDLIKRDDKIGRLENGQWLPYYDRAAINAGALTGKNAELLWVDNEIDAFFMEIQGSGRVILEDGRVQGLGFAGKNGRPYYAIGRWLVEQGYIPLEQISMQSIRAWIIDHPQEGRDLMLKNPSVVFFRLTAANDDEGPAGTMNTPLTAGYSIAVDNDYLPMGVPIWLETQPANGVQGLQRLVMAQDTGSAIKGLIRGDVYWGKGHQAGEMAGLMKSPGRFFILTPKFEKL
ncbi:MAG: MltA domain-containing protein [Methylomonas sp.]